MPKGVYLRTAKHRRAHDEASRRVGLRRVPPVRLMSEVECAYLGALIDGEGHVGNRVTMVGNYNVELISALLRATQTGRVHASFVKENKPYLIWILNGETRVRELYDQTLHYSTKARSQIDGT